MVGEGGGVGGGGGGGGGGGVKILWPLYNDTPHPSAEYKMLPR